MRIGIDFHGLLDTYPEIFQPLLATARNMGAEIYIITGPPFLDAFEQIELIGYEHLIHWDGIKSVVDWVRGRGAPMHLDHKNTWWTTDEYWWPSKAQICEAHKINVMFDDKEGYKEFFDSIDTEFILIKLDLRNK